ncbi:6-phosphofructo-2-kinase / fructose-2,6-biphosphatase 3 [Fistulifera solaris]|uniref:6-phosphofructo-2-kinase / fructose-2,6-biphosphatase 3 n=1 Tax=Fistulifera solaris TaxID=1519565 RepID=A0A1Z5JIX5_FISSO|nr:6-phosphofructo-2-kinase / fructose-2,6-biphosphatase 3 [Fistulifera solaris]|eukprot:GAX13792.1 6-phosphofructo-2-kinase / fructose-2,6-biphosphatase 3 [Fistulifera solaris]
MRQNACISGSCISISLLVTPFASHFIDYFAIHKGKTHIAKRICRFLSFFHDIPSQIFNAGDYRRQLFGATMPASFYDPTNEEGSTSRIKACNAALDDLIAYMKQEGVRVAAFDATNGTRERREYLMQSLKSSGIGAKIIFLESLCDNEQLLEENIRRVKLNTPDYRDLEPEAAVADFKRRRDHYMSVYETLEENEGPHIKIINSKRFIVNNIRGYLPLKVVHFIMNLHTQTRTFYLTRHGQSEYNLLGKIGGDSGLTPAGKEYARRLADFAKDHIGVRKVVDPNTGEESEVQQPCRLWTSTLRRTKETTQFIDHSKFKYKWDNGDTGEWVQFRPMARRNLDELYAGVCDGMTYKDIEQVYPEEFNRRQEDKLTYRYPRGESYMDVTLRLEPLAQEMERTREPVLIVGHQGILRILYAYFMGLDRKEAPYVSIPLNNVIELTPHAYGCHEKRYCLMRREEMLNDGQDEPVTSMPTKKISAAEQNVVYHPQDPVMNAPSC